MRTLVRIKNLGATDAHVEKAIESVNGVECCELHAADGEAIVEHNGADTRKILKAVRSLGYSTASIK